MLCHDVQFDSLFTSTHRIANVNDYTLIYVRSLFLRFFDSSTNIRLEHFCFGSSSNRVVNSGTNPKTGVGFIASESMPQS
jgi:hypothetical protein